MSAIAALRFRAITLRFIFIVGVSSPLSMVKSLDRMRNSRMLSARLTRSFAASIAVEISWRSVSRSSYFLVRRIGCSGF